MEERALRPTPGGGILKLRVQPRASRTFIKGFAEGALKVYLTEPPQKGRANRQCLELVAGALGLRPRDLCIVSGERARLKEVKIAGLSPSEVRARIGAALGAEG